MIAVLKGDEAFYHPEARGWAIDRDSGLLELFEEEEGGAIAAYWKWDGVRFLDEVEEGGE